MELNEYKIVFEKLNLVNSTVSGIMKVYKNNTYISIFGSVIIKDELPNVYINFSKCPTQRHNNDDILISRAIDKSIRPLMAGINKCVSIQITMLQNAAWADTKCWAIMCSLYMLRHIFNINVGVASIAIGGTYFERYNTQAGYMIVCGNAKQIVFMEMESNGIANTSEILKDLLHQAQIVADYIQQVEFKHTLIPQSLSEYKRVDRLALAHRPFDIITNTSNNSLILSRGETTILSMFNINKKSTEFSFEHIYKSSGFATNEVHSKSSRREIGHAHLVQKALYSKVSTNPILRNVATRAVSYVLNANGSTSMASVTAVCINMLKEGFLVQNELLYGISFGVVLNPATNMVELNKKSKLNKDIKTIETEGEYINTQILCDLTAHEDNMSATDFKVVCDANANIYAIQMDVKVPVNYECIHAILQACKPKFAEISKEISGLIAKKYVQQNIKRIISEELSLYFKQFGLINILKNILTRCFWDNKVYIHLQNTESNNVLQEIANFYLTTNLIEKSIVCIAITETINDSTTLNNFHVTRFTRKQTLHKGDCIRCSVTNGKLTFIECIYTAVKDIHMTK